MLYTQQVATILTEVEKKAHEAVRDITPTFLIFVHVSAGSGIECAPYAEWRLSHHAAKQGDRITMAHGCSAEAEIADLVKKLKAQKAP